MQVLVRGDKDARSELDRWFEGVEGVGSVVAPPGGLPRVCERIVIPGPDHGRPAADIVRRIIDGDLGLEAPVLLSVVAEVLEEESGGGPTRTAADDGDPGRTGGI